MLLLGSLLATFSGVANSTAAALQKREAVEVGTAERSFRLLAALVRRPWWLLTIALSVMAWTAQASALALAPIVAVTPLMSLGRGGLVLAGIRWLNERFTVSEIVGLSLVTAGGIAATLSTPDRVDLRPLGVIVLVGVGVGSLASSWIVARWHNALAYGVAAGLLYAATGVYTKEIGDAVARNGLIGVLTPVGVGEVAAMILLTTFAQMYTQHGLQRANVASLSAATAMLSMNGLLIAGFALYHQPYPGGVTGVVLGASLAASALGTGMLSGPIARMTAAAAGDPEASGDHAHHSHTVANPGASDLPEPNDLPGTSQSQLPPGFERTSAPRHRPGEQPRDGWTARQENRVEREA